MPDEWKESTIVPVYKKGDKMECSNYTGISLLSTMYKFYPSSCCQGLLKRQRKLLGIINVDFNTTDPLLIVYSAFVKYLRKKWEYNEAVHQLFIDFKNACVSVMGAIFYNILIEFGIPMKLVRLIKMCLSETYSRVQVGQAFVWCVSY